MYNCYTMLGTDSVPCLARYGRAEPLQEINEKTEIANAGLVFCRCLSLSQLHHSKDGVVDTIVNNVTMEASFFRMQLSYLHYLHYLANFICTICSLVHFIYIMSTI